MERFEGAKVERVEAERQTEAEEVVIMEAESR